MRARILLGIMIMVLLSVRAAFPQAAAESVMLNAHSAAATTKAGSVLGDALNKASHSIAGQIQTAPKSTATTVSGKVQHVQVAKTRPAGAATAPVAASGTSASGKPASGTSMITSIQGARKN
jgi:hypothetical protein